MTSIFDLHVHTNRGSPDSGLTAEELVTEAGRIGLTGVMVTEHDGWPRHDFEEFSREQNLIMVRALEVYTPLGHVITLGLENHVSGYSRDIETIRLLRKEVDRVGGFMILAHPFRFLFDLPGVYTQNKLFEDAATVPTTARSSGSTNRHRLLSAEYGTTPTARSVADDETMRTRRSGHSKKQLHKLTRVSSC